VFWDEDGTSDGVPVLRTRETASGVGGVNPQRLICWPGGIFIMTD
jgi:hypothetical protein